MSQAVKVVVRCRPMNKNELEKKCKNIVRIDQKIKQVTLIKPNENSLVKNFTYDNAFPMESLQQTIYQQTAFPLVESVLQGYNGTMFAYGQTGCGKTFTMMGISTNEEIKGIIPRTFNHILTTINSQNQKTYLDTKYRMEIKESTERGVFIKDLIKVICKNQNQLQKNMNIGNKNRCTGNLFSTAQTAMNKDSSRSHSLFTIYLDNEIKDELGNQKFASGKLNLVDLAGSQRQSKTEAVGDRFKQATKINLSLSALGNVISSLVDGKSTHIPYRDSKLTRLLQDSLGGNTKTIMIAAISPADFNYEQTLSTLRYASRAKFIKNKPKINEDPKDALLREYEQEIKKLKMMLEGKAPIDLIQMQQNSNHQIDNQFGMTLIKKQLMLMQQQTQRKALQQQLQKLQNRLKIDEPTKVNQVEVENYKKIKQKLKAQKKKQQEMKLQAKKKEEELLTMEKSYKNLNQQVIELRSKFQEVKIKYLNSITEVKDIQQQNQSQKSDFLDTIRYQQKQINFLNAILKVLLSEQQIQIIKSSSQWNDTKNQYKIPPFYLINKEINFPKLRQNEAFDLINQKKDHKNLIFQNCRKNNSQLTENQKDKLNNKIKKNNLQKRMKTQIQQNIKDQSNNHHLRVSKDFNVNQDVTSLRIKTVSKSVKIFNQKNKRSTKIPLQPLKQQGRQKNYSFFNNNQKVKIKKSNLQPIFSRKSNANIIQLKQFNQKNNL